MMRKGISDVDSVMTVRELVRLIRLYGIDVTNIEPEPPDEPMSGRSSTAALAEVSGGFAESVVRTYFYKETGREVEKGLFKKVRLAGNFREMTIDVLGKELSIAIIDGLTGLDKLKAAMESGSHFDLVEVMACQGGCINGAGLPYGSQKEDRKNRARVIYQADETDAINLGCKSPVMMNLLDKLIKENKEISDRKLFHTQFARRDVLL